MMPFSLPTVSLKSFPYFSISVPASSDMECQNTISVTFSTFVALTLSPALCGLLLKPHETGAQSSLFAGFFAKFNDWFDRVTGSYAGQVGRLVSRLRLGVIALLVITVLMGMLYKLVPSTFIPQEDQGFYIASVTLDE